MTNLQQHYKDSLPIKTITNIDNFFKSRNCEILETNHYCGDSGTYSSHYILKYNNKIILTSNGKGANEIYTQASGYAEMYERFCAIPLHFGGNPILINKYQQMKNDSFSLDIDNDEYLRDFFYLRSFNLSENIDNNSFIKEIFFNNNILGVPYKTLDQQNIKYFNQYTISSLIGSNGLAAGNTLEEALVQGSSELYERYCINQFWNNPQNKFYYLDNQQLYQDYQDYIINIKKNINCDIYIYDLSYNFNVPVCMMLVIDNTNNIFHIIFGAHPIMNIAIERCFTEMFQGFDHLPNKKLIIPFNAINQLEISFLHMSHMYNTIDNLPLNLLQKSQKLDKNQSSEIFLYNNMINNQELLNHIIKINNLNNFQFYYYDLSLNNNIKAIQVINIKNLNPEFFYLQKKWFDQIFLDKNAVELIKKFIYNIQNNNFNNILEVYTNLDIIKYLNFDLFCIENGMRTNRLDTSILLNKILNKNFLDLTNYNLFNCNFLDEFQKFINSNDDIILQDKLQQLYNNTLIPFLKLFK